MIGRPLRSTKWCRLQAECLGQKLAANDALFQAGHLPDLKVRGVQIRLAYVGFDPNGVDGVMGNGTRRALLSFQQARGLPANGNPDLATLEALQAVARV